MDGGFQFNANPKPVTAGAPAAAKPAGRPLPKRGMPVIAGLPLGLWLAAAGGIVLAIVLGVFVWQKFSGKTSKSKATDDAAETSTDEPAAGSKPKKERKPLRSGKPAATDAGT